jgi:hypothetical protein
VQARRRPSETEIDAAAGREGATHSTILSTQVASAARRPGLPHTLGTSSSGRVEIEEEEAVGSRSAGNRYSRLAKILYCRDVRLEREGAGGIDQLRKSISTSVSALSVHESALHVFDCIM